MRERAGTGEGCAGAGGTEDSGVRMPSGAGPTWKAGDLAGGEANARVGKRPAQQNASIGDVADAVEAATSAGCAQRGGGGDGTQTRGAGGVLPVEKINSDEISEAGLGSRG